MLATIFQSLVQQHSGELVAVMSVLGTIREEASLPLFVKIPFSKFYIAH